MTYRLDGRLIADSTESYRALEILKDLCALLSVRPELTVCEPFTENLQHYDIVFHAELPDPEDVATNFDRMLRRIPGDWRLTPPIVSEDGKAQLFAVLDNTAGPRAGVVWLSLGLNHSSMV